jgi:signal transduction histidine kinase
MGRGKRRTVVGSADLAGRGSRAGAPRRPATETDATVHRPLHPAADPAEQDLGLRRRFLCLQPADEQLLGELREPIERRAEALVEAFYQHLLAFEPVRHLLAEPKTVERLKGIQRDYLRSLTAGARGREYLQQRQRIGRVHELLGLHPQWYLGAYGIYLDTLAAVVMDRFAADPDRACRAMGTLTKMMLLDAQIVLDAYFQTRQQKAVERTEHLAAVGELAASIAHEVRNPLAGMKGAIEVLRRSFAVDERQREVMDELVAQIVRLENLVRDLLTFAHPSTLSRQRVQLHALLERALRLVRDEAGMNGIRVVRDFPPGTGAVLGDAQQLEQVFLNLIHNAIQAMEDGGTLEVSTRAERDHVSISFRDTGKGIAPAVLPNIFQPFFTTKHRGSGLGLSIVRKIIEAHDGEIEVASEPGVGTTATLTLPYHEVER